MGPPTCVGNRGIKEYVLIRPTTTMGKVINVTTLYYEWLKEVKIDLTTHSRQAGETAPPVLLNFPARLIAQKFGRGNIGSANDCHTTRNETHQGQTCMGSALDRKEGESNRVCTDPLLQHPIGQAVLSPSDLVRFLRKPATKGGLAQTTRVPNQTGPRSQYCITFLIEGYGCSQYRLVHPTLASKEWSRPHTHTCDLINWIKLATFLRHMIPMTALEQTRGWTATS
jgi:hypothetical protein